MRIAWFTPYYPSSAIGTYGEAIVDEMLAQGHEVSIFTPARAEFGGIRPTRHRCVAIDTRCDDALLAHARQHDISIYNMGNNLPYHQEIFTYLRAQPGIVILHDLVLRDFFWTYYLEQLGAPAELLAELSTAHGPDAYEHGRKLITGELANTFEDENRLAWPFCRPALVNALGVVVHSEYSYQRLKDAGVQQVRRIDFPCFGPIAEALSAGASRATAASKVKILTVGDVNSNKLVHLTIETIGASPLLREAVEFNIIGEGNPGYRERLVSLIEQLNLTDTVRLLGYQPDHVLKKMTEEADIVVNLRRPHFGESSATLLCSLLAGIPTVVWDHGYYAEFPDNVVCKIDRTDSLTEVLERLVRDPEERKLRSTRSRQHAQVRFRTDRYVNEFIPFAEQMVMRRGGCELIDHVSEFLKELGARPDDHFVQRIAAETARFTAAKPTAVTVRRAA